MKNRAAELLRENRRRAVCQFVWDLMEGLSHATAWVPTLTLPAVLRAPFISLTAVIAPLHTALFERVLSVLDPKLLLLMGESISLEYDVNRVWLQSKTLVSAPTITVSCTCISERRLVLLIELVHHVYRRVSTACPTEGLLCRWPPRLTRCPP